MARNGDTFGGTWHRPGEIHRRDRQRGRNLGDLQDRASFDHQSEDGCGAIFLICATTITAGIALLKRHRA